MASFTASLIASRKEATDLLISISTPSVSQQRNICWILGVFGEVPYIGHACAYPNGHVMRNRLCPLRPIVIFACWRRNGTISACYCALLSHYDYDARCYTKDYSYSVMVDLQLRISVELQASIPFRSYLSNFPGIQHMHSAFIDVFQ